MIQEGYLIYSIFDTSSFLLSVFSDSLPRVDHIKYVIGTSFHPQNDNLTQIVDDPQTHSPKKPCWFRPKDLWVMGPLRFRCAL